MSGKQGLLRKSEASAAMFCLRKSEASAAMFCLCESEASAAMFYLRESEASVNKTQSLHSNLTTKNAYMKKRSYFKIIFE